MEICTSFDLSKVCILMFYLYSLTTKLPFEDDEFDHVHIQAIAKGVPENKVSWVQYPDTKLALMDHLITVGDPI